MLLSATNKRNVMRITSKQDDQENCTSAKWTHWKQKAVLAEWIHFVLKRSFFTYCVVQRYKVYILNYRTLSEQQIEIYQTDRKPLAELNIYFFLSLVFANGTHTNTKGRHKVGQNTKKPPL